MLHKVFKKGPCTLKCDWKGLIASSSLSTLSFIPGYCMFPPVKNTLLTSASCCSGVYLYVVQKIYERHQYQCINSNSKNVN